MSVKPMVRRRGSIADVMKAFSSGSSSSSSVCGLGTLTSAISNSFARAREMRASNKVLMSASFTGTPCQWARLALTHFRQKAREARRHSPAF
jgi:hypothetical protein